MNQPKAYGTFLKRGDNTFRTTAYIQWGDSEKSIGSCLLLNPGSANFDKDSALYTSLQTLGQAEGEIKMDPTMKQLVKLIHGIYGEDRMTSGRFHIYNLFALQNTASIHAIDQFEQMVECGKYDITESLIDHDGLQAHPWMLLGWSVERNPTRWRNLELIKELWRQRISEANVPTFGKRHKKRDDYYHPCPLIPTHQPTMLADLITLYKQKFNKQRFPVHATRPNLIVDSNPLKDWNDSNIGWFKASTNPENIVRGYSHMRIKDGFKLRAYQFSDGANGNGFVYAIPIDKELPALEECVQTDNHDFAPPRPAFALSDFMEAIDGDMSPASYLQAAIVLHELHEFGASWHGVSWGRDIILPLDPDQQGNTQEHEWEMIEAEPDIIEPHFYYSIEGNPTIVFYTINDIGSVTLNRYVHTFKKENYTQQVQRTCIATADGGIIF